MRIYFLKQAEMLFLVKSFKRTVQNVLETE